MTEIKNYTDLKAFEDACKVLKLDNEKVIPDFSSYPEKDRKAMIAHAKLVIIVKASNQLANDGKEWIPDFSNYDELKYEAWFDLEGGSSGFRYRVCDRWSTFSRVGSRLCFISRGVCEYIAEQFIDLYRDYFL